MSNDYTAQGWQRTATSLGQDIQKLRRQNDRLHSNLSLVAVRIAEARLRKDEPGPVKINLTLEESDEIIDAIAVWRNPI